MKISPIKIKKKEKKLQPDDVKIHKRKRRLKYIAVLPSFITLMNCAFGFMSIYFASRSQELNLSFLFVRSSYISTFALAGYLIILAMIADMLDGRVARLTRTTSSFGGQLDSLADAVSFGAAPAFLMIKLVEFNIGNYDFGNPRFSFFLMRGIVFAAIFYLMCAVVRLARFNVENEEDESAHMNFVGLPSPAAAGVVVSIVIIHQQITKISALGSFQNFDRITIFAIPVITFLAGILMVSRIRYPHLANLLLRGKKTLSSLLSIFACGILIVWNNQLMILVGFCGFALFGVFRWIIFSLTKKKPEQIAHAETKKHY